MELPDDRSEAVDNDPRAAQMVGDEIAGLVGRGCGRMLLTDNTTACRGDAFQECVFLQRPEAKRAGVAVAFLVIIQRGELGPVREKVRSSTQSFPGEYKKEGEPVRVLPPIPVSVNAC